MEEREDIVAYIDTLKVGEGLDEKQIMQGYERFKNQKNAAALAAIADSHGIEQSALQVLVDTILTRLIFDGEQLSDLFADHKLPWRERTDKELALMADLVPLLKKRAKGREISGLAAYEQ
jgi:type I restriction enzyme R subunit